MKVVAVLCMFLALVGCSKVQTGHVGIKVYLLGGSKGVDTEELGPGRYWIGMNEELYVFPTFTQNYVWTAGEDEGSEADESIGFQTVEGLAVDADVGISYRINPEMVDEIFQKYRRGVDEITDTYLRNMIRDSLVKNASTMRVESVYGSGKTKLIEQVQADVSNQVGKLGIDIEKIYWIGELRLPEQVTNSINAKIQATQMTQQRQNEIAQSVAEADKAIEEARGKAESQLAMARAEAQAIEIKGAALRQNPQLLELSAIEKWNGVLPYVNGGGAMPFIKVPETKTP